MKAWKVSSKYEDYSCIIFAKTRGQAKTIALDCDECFPDSEFTDLYVRRQPEADDFYDTPVPMNWGNAMDRLFMVKKLGFVCGSDIYDYEDCETCVAKQYCDLCQDKLTEGDKECQL